MYVATALTVHGIETLSVANTNNPSFLVATALTVHGIETKEDFGPEATLFKVATALTVHGIETTHRYPSSMENLLNRCNSTYRSRY